MGRRPILQGFRWRDDVAERRGCVGTCVELVPRLAFGGHSLRGRPGRAPRSSDRWRFGSRGKLTQPSPVKMMRIPADAVIDDAKLTEYLLVQRPWDDKSGYLHRAGFNLENWTELRQAIRRLADAVDAVEDGSNEYGTFYRTEGFSPA